MNYYIYRLSDGYILASGQCQSMSQVVAMVEDGVSAAGVSDQPVAFNTHRFADNSLVAYTAEQKALLEQPRGRGFAWNATTCTWVDERSQETIKAEKWAAIKAAREQAIEAGLTTPYGTFDADTKARGNITDAILMLQTLAALGTPQTIDFTLADNTTATLTTEQMVHVGLLLGAKVQAAHAQARALRDQIDAATTAAEVEAITWTP